MMQNLILKFRQSSSISEKPGNLHEKLKTLRAPTTVEFIIFYWNFPHVSVLRMSTKGCVGFFKFCLDLELLINLVSVSV